MMRCLPIWVLFALALSAAPQQPGLDRVGEALRAERPEEAIRLLQPLLEARPGDPRLWTMSGIALARANRPNESLDAYDKALQLKPDYLPAIQGAAEAAFHSGHASARQRLEKLLAVQPDSAVAHAMLGSLAYSNEDCAGAVSHFERSGSIVEKNTFVAQQYAECLFLSRRPTDAAPIFRRLLEAEPGDDSLRYNLGLSLEESGRHDEAAAVLQPLANSDKADPDALSLLAEAQEAHLDTPGALETLKKAIRLFPKQERLYLQLAELCMQHNSYDLGLEVTQAGIENLSTTPGLLTMQGVIYAQLGRYSEAEAAFEKATAQDPQQRSAALGLTLTLQKTGRLGESIETLRGRRREHPEDAVTAFLLAQALIRRGVSPGQPEFEEARQALELAVPALPAEAEPRVALGKLYLASGEIDQAVKALREAVNLDSSDRAATYQLMMLLRRADRDEEAQQVAKRIREQLSEDKKEEIQRNRYRLVKGDSP
jgi:tetratricopeptide (TPR) repeat protein